MKRTFTILLVILCALSLSLTLLACGGKGDNKPNSGDTVIIKSNEDYDDEDVDYSKAVVVEGTTLKGLTEYGKTLSRIVIPSSVTSIASWAFASCINLTSIEIPSSVASIGDKAFVNCLSLTSVTIPSSVTSIGEEAFSYCFSLVIKCESSEFKFENTIVSIEEGDTIVAPILYNCRNNEMADDGYIYVVAGNGIQYALKDEIAKVSGHFYISGDITIASKVSYKGKVYQVQEIDLGTFFGCTDLTRIDIPSSITAIGDGAFGDCSSLTSIEIPSNVTSIGILAFSDCSSMTSIEISSSVTSIGDKAFSFCSSLRSVTFGDNSQLASISDYVFYGCSDLTSLELPDSITSIGILAFSGCSSLTSIEIPSSVTSIGDYAFENCWSLTSVTFGDNSQLTSVGDYAFYDCSSLTSIELPNSITSIGNGAFVDCSSLTSVKIPSNATSIGIFAFSGCNSLTSVKFENTSGWYIDDGNGTSIDVTDPSTNATNITSEYLEYIWKRNA